MLAGVEQALLCEGGCGRSLDRKCRSAEPPKVMVVEDDDLAVDRQADVALNSGAGVDRGAERGEAILGYSWTVESAMREPHGTRIQWISF